MSYKHDLYNDKFFDEVFQQKQGGYFVELGAFHGVTLSQTYFLEKQRDWRGIIVEPNPMWTKSLMEERQSHVITQPVSDKDQLVSFAVYRDNPALSRIDDGSGLPQGDIHFYKMRARTLSSLLTQMDSPDEIDVVCLDIEGMELKVLDELFTNSDVKVNLIVLESDDVHSVLDFFYNKHYVKIKNPYLQFLKVDRKKEMVLEFDRGNFRYIDNGEIYQGSILDLDPINWEYYYLHIDMLKKHPCLKKLIEPINYHTSNV